MGNVRRATTAALCGILFTLGSVLQAAAHPHVWVTTRAKLLFENSAVVGITQSWTFDELYTAMAIQGLDANGDGTYSREELAELAKVNIEGIQEFDYFTDARLGDKRLKVTERDDYWLDHKDGTLTLHFTVTLESPVLAEAEGFSFSVYDPSYFIAYEFAKADAVALGSGAPAGCQAHLSNKDGADAEALNDALLAQLGDYAGGVSLTKKVSINCPRS
ncbi:MAG: DUF1007 family protein [Alphaproteobacteria bacterium]|nr:DUF1007 family protein [Alphaproteobacteria bacterium]